MTSASAPEEPGGTVLPFRAHRLRLPAAVDADVEIAARRRADLYLDYEAPWFVPEDAGLALLYGLALDVARLFPRMPDALAHALAAVDAYLPRAHIARLMDDLPVNAAQLAVNPADARLAGWCYASAATPVRLATEYRESLDAARDWLPDPSIPKGGRTWT